MSIANPFDAKFSFKSVLKIFELAMRKVAWRFKAQESFLKELFKDSLK